MIIPVKVGEWDAVCMLVRHLDQPRDEPMRLGSHEIMRVVGVFDERDAAQQICWSRHGVIVAQGRRLSMGIGVNTRSSAYRVNPCDLIPQTEVATAK